MSKPHSQKGEGDRESDRRYREHTRDFVDSGKVDEKAEEARREGGSKPLREAEKAGRQRAKEEDPNVKRDYEKTGAR